jgi:MinD-like ATPase involved in chromosome partitioning or flagellar assembly
MYTITFYSFKGGVGRTLALVNVGAELARRGRKVLLVDFDLEAPGLETFDRLRPKQPHPGVVEYVKEYLFSKQSPDVRDYIYAAKAVGNKGGQLWVMPAGRRDANYQAALASIDWKRLYRDCDGFLLFEDTKAQWEQEFKPDYVLVDSRTGNTDVEGICTRQLPDAVVVLFFPNEQNLAGLRDVCRRIRGEKDRRKLKEDIRLHFVMSNVPDLDDEDRILCRRVESFHKDLVIDKLAAVIHRYESVLLFNQAVFVLDKPRSRLAREYRRLVRALIQPNLADRDAALRFLDDYAPQDLSEVRRKIDKLMPGYRDHLNEITARFLDDADVLYQVAQCRKREGDFKAAVALLTRALERNPGLAARALYERALGRAHLGDSSGAVKDLLQYLRIPALGQADVLRALRVLHPIAPHMMPDAVDLPAVRGLDDRTKLDDVCPLLTDSDEALQRAIGIVRHVMAHPMAPEPGKGIVRIVSEPQGRLPRYLLAARRWRELIEILEKGIEILEKEGVESPCDRFDLAMSYWGETGNFREDLCGLALEAERQGPGVLESEYPGAKLWLLWRVGKIPEALHLLDLDEKQVESRGELAFSYWRCRFVYPEKYREDCQQLRRMIQGEPIRPAFLGDPSPSPSA